jgi:hypothetical protein
MCASPLLMGWQSFVEEGAMGARMLSGLPRFLRQPAPSVAHSRAALGASFRNRERAFLELLRRAVFEHAASPYAPLFQQAAITHATCEQLVRDHGVEGALNRIHDAGVHVSLDEFKGRRPIRRGSLTIDTSGRVFDNPLLARHFAGRTSGSRGPGARFILDLDFVAHDAHYDVIFFDMFNLGVRPGGLWHPAPPGAAGMKWALRIARFGYPLERWFSQTPISVRHDAKNAAITRAVSGMSRLSGRPIPLPRHVPLPQAASVAEWLAACRSRGTPAWLSTTASSAVRVCLAARDQGLDISGTFFRASGEPLTAAKARVVADAHCTARCHYAMAEVGRMGVACGRPSTYDDVHVAADKVAFAQRDVTLAGGAQVPALFLTTLHWTVPKVMLNVEIGDYAVSEPRSCGCIWDTIGFTHLLHTLRSYEKLTSEGMHFIGADLHAIVDDVLPARFGGDATDYQFVEEECNGLPGVCLIVSDRVGEVNASEVQTTVLNALAARNLGNRMMTILWRDGGTLRVVRRHPYATNGGKILALHVARGVPQ